LIIRSDDPELVDEVRGFLNSLEDGNYREKIREAIKWAKIYVDLKQSAHYDGGRETFRGLLY